MRLHDAKTLIRSGRFADALKTLTAGPTSTAERLEAEILRVSLLERLGQHAQSRDLAERALRSRSLAPAFQSDCRFSLGMLDYDAGRLEAALEHWHRATELAKQAKDFSRACWVQLRLMLVNCSTVAPQNAAHVISTTRREVLQLGDPLALAALHVYVGEVAIKHGALHTARRHTGVGLTLLERTPNVWLESLARNNLVALALIDCDITSGLEQATAALAAAERSGGIYVRRASLGNLGNLHALQGSWDLARSYFRRSLEGQQLDGEFSNCIVESIARLHLLEGRLSDAREQLDAIDAASASELRSTLYAHRHSKLTRALLLIREGHLERALEQADLASSLAARSGDRLLSALSELTRSEILLIQGRRDESLRRLDAFTGLLPGLPIELVAHYERVVGLALEDPDLGRAHLARAARTFNGLQHQPGLLEVRRTAQATGVALPEESLAIVPRSPLEAAGKAVQDVLSALLHAGNVDLLARDLVEVLATTGSVANATAMATLEDGRTEGVASYARPLGTAAPVALPERTYVLGGSRGRSVRLTCRPLPSVEAVATVNAVASLIAVVRELETAKYEREERLGLWPADDLPDADDEAVITGAMREVMRLARKVAPTSASVLITGESGTGKEIVARALHRFSNRTQWPFVPFNCTAVPRELLESHLFGYRRGAFTGAERDHPGVVRSAKQGTVFLDEIGELSLDLQPKLLRFLESGEVHPLGEAEPVKVEARVVAATNADLESLVREGRFRADLFYRLRVIPLTIPPLRERRDEIPHLARHFVSRMAAEFNKGRLDLHGETMELLVLYSWPGNVRQLSNELRRVVALADCDVTLTPDMLSEEIRRGRFVTNAGQHAVSITPNETLATALSKVEREMIATALKSHRGRLDDAARALGISRKGLYLKRLRLGL
ncbi:MAG: sigma 54-interacting transcriptional regulator [Vicinamibacterales bacterium]